MQFFPVIQLKIFFFAIYSSLTLTDAINMQYIAV